MGDLTIKDVSNNLEKYRNQSKKWRDQVTQHLVEQISTSSQKFQDNLFDENAMPPRIIAILAEENIKHKGVVERYIYQQFKERQKRVLSLKKY